MVVLSSLRPPGTTPVTGRISGPVSGAENAQQHRQRINCSVGNRRSIGRTDGVGESQCGRIGHASGDHAADDGKIDFENQPGTRPTTRIGITVIGETGRPAHCNLAE